MTLPEMPVIDDNNWEQWTDGGPKGYFGMWQDEDALASAKPFSELGIPLIPESEWDDIIDEQEKQEATIRHLCMEMGLPPLNQGRTNYCWVNAPTHCCEITRLMQTGQLYRYSPASCGAPIKSFRNVGGWGSQALTRLESHGVNLIEDWPANAISRTYHTESNRERAAKHKVLEYYVLESWEERASCILAGIPTADGYPWWRHEVCGTGIVKRTHDLEIRNSWGPWGDGHGFGVLKGRRKLAGDSVAIVSMRPV